MIDIDSLTTRELQKEAARALAYWRPTNGELSFFNKQAHHDSHGFYKAVLRKYIAEHGTLPSQGGPAQAIELFFKD